MDTTTLMKEGGSASPSDQLLTTDCLGRVKVPREYREELLDRFEQSSMSGAAFAEHYGVKYQTFASWIQKRRRERGEYPKPAPQAPAALIESLVEVEVDPPRSDRPEIDTRSLRLELPKGVRCELDHPDQIALVGELVAHLTR